MINFGFSLKPKPPTQPKFRVVDVTVSRSKGDHTTQPMVYSTIANALLYSGREPLTLCRLEYGGIVKEFNPPLEVARYEKLEVTLDETPAEEPVAPKPSTSGRSPTKRKTVKPPMKRHPDGVVTLVGEVAGERAKLPLASNHFTFEYDTLSVTIPGSFKKSFTIETVLWALHATERSGEFDLPIPRSVVAGDEISFNLAGYVPQIEEHTHKPTTPNLTQNASDESKYTFGFTNPRSSHIQYSSLLEKGVSDYLTLGWETQQNLQLRAYQAQVDAYAARVDSYKDELERRVAWANSQ